MDEWRDRIDVSSWQVREVEPAGSHESLWLAQPTDERDPDEVLWLHKFTVTPNTGIEQGEDWAEVVSTQVGMALGVPCAKTRLCVRNGARGSISRSVRPHGYSLYEGRLALEWSGAPGYFAHVEGSAGVDPDRPEVVRPGHSITNIQHALAGHVPPAGFEGPDGCTAFDVFAGYLILDALIANRDRHEQNWAILLPERPAPPPMLSPSYDHASSLGFNVTDQNRERMLADPELLVRWVERGTAYRFEHTKGQPVTLVDHAVAALNACSATSRTWWSQRVGSLDLTEITEPVLEGAVDSLSHPAATLAVRILELNRRRLSDALPTNS